MSYEGFKWVEPTLAGLYILSVTSSIGRMYEVNMSYPKQLYEKHNNQPFLPNNSKPPGS